MAHPLHGANIGTLARPMLERQLPRTRYVDDRPVTTASPREAAFALANMSPLAPWIAEWGHDDLAPAGAHR